MYGGTRGQYVHAGKKRKNKVYNLSFGKNFRKFENVSQCGTVGGTDLVGVAQPPEHFDQRGPKFLEFHHLNLGLRPGVATTSDCKNQSANAMSTGAKLKEKNRKEYTGGGGGGV